MLGAMRTSLCVCATCSGTRNVRACFAHEGEKDSEGATAIISTALDPGHGGICPHSQAALIALLEKRMAFAKSR
jgi:hypothetical protein